MLAVKPIRFIKPACIACMMKEPSLAALELKNQRNRDFSALFL